MTSAMRTFSAAKSPYVHFTSNYSNFAKIDPRKSFEDEIVESLQSNDVDKKVQALNRLKAQAQSDSQWLSSFSRKSDIFRNLNNILFDANWQLQYAAVRFIADTVHTYGKDTDWCMALVLPNLSARLSSSKITVRKAAAQALRGYIVCSKSTGTVQRNIMRHGVCAFDEEHERLCTALRELPTVYSIPNTQDTPDTQIDENYTQSQNTIDWHPLVDELTALLVKLSGAISRDVDLNGKAEKFNIDDSDKNRAVELILLALEKLLARCGQKQFNKWISLVPQAHRLKYEYLLMDRQAKTYLPGAGNLPDMRSRIASETGQVKLGIIPLATWDQLNTDNQPKIRCSGLEQLRNILPRLSNSEKQALVQHLGAYVKLLDTILDDLDPKVTVLGLDVLRASVDVLRDKVEAHAQAIFNAASKHFGNQKTVVKQCVMLTLLSLMQYAGVKPTVTWMAACAMHRNSRVREEMLNVLTAAVLKFPSTQFNLPALAFVVAPRLADSRRRVRLAAFETVAVLAQTMGAGKLEPLYKCIRDVEQSQRAAGLMNAVQARLARHQLPKIKYDGLIEYAPPPNVGEKKGSPGVQDLADVQWILNAAAGPGSALSRDVTLSDAQIANQQVGGNLPANQHSMKNDGKGTEAVTPRKSGRQSRSAHSHRLGALPNSVIQSTQSPDSASKLAPANKDTNLKLRQAQSNSELSVSSAKPMRSVTHLRPLNHARPGMTPAMRHTSTFPSTPHHDNIFDPAYASKRNSTFEMSQKNVFPWMQGNENDEDLDTSEGRNELSRSAPLQKVGLFLSIGTLIFLPFLLPCFYFLSCG